VRGNDRVCGEDEAQDCVIKSYAIHEAYSYCWIVVVEYGVELVQAASHVTDVASGVQVLMNVSYQNATV